MTVSVVAFTVALCSANARERQTQTSGWTSPEQFLADKETDLAGIVKVRRAETRWVILSSDGDHVPLIVLECEMQENLSGNRAWPVGRVQSVVQVDYSDMLFEPIAPPAIEGRRYLLWALVTPKDSEVPFLAPWTAHPQGLLLIRGPEGSEFVFWSGKSYGVPPIRAALKAGQRVPLNQIVDPARRLRVAEGRLERKNLGNEKAFIQGLLLNVLDAEGQAKRVERQPVSNIPTDTFGMSAGNAQPHAIWYNSLTLLRDLGKDEKRRKAVVTVLTPVARTARPRIRLTAALALADLGSDAGREALIHGFESDSGPISSDPPDQMTFPGRYHYDESSISACAYALARLGDRRGLAHPTLEVRLAAADALKDKPDPELRRALEKMATDLDPKVEQLRVSGELSKARDHGDYTNRYPEDWTRIRRLLARLGDDDSLRRLVEAYIVDAATYPPAEAPLIPRQIPSSWSKGPSPAQAIRGAETNSADLLQRLRTLFGKDPRWDSASFKDLRASFEQLPNEESSKPGERKPTETEITKLLTDPDPNRRAEALAAAGYHQIDVFYDKVLETALQGTGIEKTAAIYALGFYGRDVPGPALRELMKSDDDQIRLSAFELATRKDAGRFASESMDVVRAWVRQPKGSESSTGAYMLRILCRLARGTLPSPLLDGLKDQNAEVRRIVVLALELGGNPDAVRSLEPLTRDPDPTIREAAQTAIRSLGPTAP
jgi:HEAT repeat protein